MIDRSTAPPPCPRFVYDADPPPWLARALECTICLAPAMCPVRPPHPPADAGRTTPRFSCSLVLCLECYRAWCGDRARCAPCPCCRASLSLDPALHPDAVLMALTRDCGARCVDCGARDTVDRLRDTHTVCLNAALVDRLAAEHVGPDGRHRCGGGAFTCADGCRWAALVCAVLVHEDPGLRRRAAAALARHVRTALAGPGAYWTRDAVRSDLLDAAATAGDGALMAVGRAWMAGLGGDGVTLSELDALCTPTGTAGGAYGDLLGACAMAYVVRECARGATEWVDDLCVNPCILALIPTPTLVGTLVCAADRAAPGGAFGLLPSGRCAPAPGRHRPERPRGRCWCAMTRSPSTPRSRGSCTSSPRGPRRHRTPRRRSRPRSAPRGAGGASAASRPSSPSGTTPPPRSPRTRT
jgi:hypothetical protein